MSLSNTTNRTTLNGNGVATNIPVSFPFNSQADLIVISTVIATGVQTTLALTTNYTITGTPDAYGNYPNGGTVVMNSAPASTVRITVYRDPPTTQGASLQDNSALPVKPSVENPLDKLTMLVIRSRELISRCFQLTETDNSGGALKVLPVANRALYFDASKNLTTSQYDSDAQQANAAASATAAASSASAAATSAANAATSATASAASAATLQGTSATSVTIATGAQTFTTQSGKQFSAGEWLLITSNANSANYMHGQVTSYSGTSLVMNITDIGGSGAYTDWTITVSGTRGAVGPSIPLAASGGTTDAITATFSPAISLTDQTLCAVVCGAGKNTTTTPSFAPNGLTAHTITKEGGAALSAGDIGAVGFVALLEYNSAYTRWELLNPCTVAYADMPAGSIIQVVASVANTGVSTTSATPVDTGLVLAITPRFATSKLLIFFSINNIMVDAQSTYMGFNLLEVETSTIIQTPGVSFGYDARVVTTAGLFGGLGCCTGQVLRVPGAAGMITYKVQFFRGTGTGNCKIMNNSDASSMTIMEVKQ